MKETLKIKGKKLKLTTLGFTLIELLAVIVILAIISLIAVPIVIHIVNDTKISSEEQSIELYMKAVQTAITKENLERKLSPKRCMINFEGNLICDKDENNIIKIEIKGKKPTDGVITFKDNRIYTYRNVKIDSLYYHKNSKGMMTSTTEPKFYTLCKSTTGSVSLELGTKYECEVNDGTIYNFYVLSTENDNKTINLIMDRNICEDGTINYVQQNNYCKYAWYEDEENNKYGPVTAMTKLYLGTKYWENVPNMNLAYEDEGYTLNHNFGYKGITIKDGIGKIIGNDGTIFQIQIENNMMLKARLPKFNEVSNVECNTSSATCPAWLVQNLQESSVTQAKELYVSTSKIPNVSGYWLLSSFQGYKAFARIVKNDGGIDLNGNSGNRTHYKTYGIRPVITVSIDYLSS